MNWQLLPKGPRARFLRQKRAKLEYLLKRCWVPDTRDAYTLQIELINIRLQEMGEGLRGNRHKPTF